MKNTMVRALSATDSVYIDIRSNTEIAIIIA